MTKRLVMFSGLVSRVGCVILIFHGLSSSRLNVPTSEINIDTPNRSAVLKDLHAHPSTANILGRGSYGTVFKAIYKGKQVAVKILDSKRASKISTLRNEANILGWEHEHIIKIHKIDFNDSYGVVIMERFPGKCLQSILDSYQIPLYHRILISLDTISALNFCHIQKLVHLDVKPQNILIAFTSSQKSPGGKRCYICKLCDFGSSLKINHQNESLDHVKGTVRYMSPEALKKNKITPAADVYSLGITMWQLKTRKIPYAIMQQNEVVAYRVVKDGLRPDSEDLSKSKPTPTLHHNCLCEPFSSDFSNNSKDTDSLDISASTKLSGSSPLLLRSIGSRSPFINLSNRINVVGGDKLKGGYRPINRELIKSLTPRKSDSKVVIKICNENGEEVQNNEESIAPLGMEYDLKSIFRAPALKNKNVLKHAEQVYENIYKSCWKADPEKRTKIPELKENLLNVLFNIS